MNDQVMLFLRIQNPDLFVPFLNQAGITYLSATFCIEWRLVEYQLVAGSFLFLGFTVPGDPDLGS